LKYVAKNLKTSGSGVTQQVLPGHDTDLDDNESNHSGLEEAEVDDDGANKIDLSD
jgi:hypothetical protein